MEGNFTLAPCVRLIIKTWMPYFVIVKTTPPYAAVGPLIEILDIIFDKLDICVEWVLSKGGYSYGNRLPNNTWTDFIGQLVAGEGDMSTLVTITDERMTVLDFSEPLYMDTYAIGYKRPVQGPDLAGFIKPFTLQIWLFLLLCIMVVLLSTVCIHYLFTRLTIGCRLKHIPSSPANAKISYATVSSSIWYAIGWTFTVLLSQSSTRYPRGNSLKFIMGTWLLVAFIIGTIYRGNLKAMLILPNLQLPFDNLEELVETKIHAIVPIGSALYRYIMESPKGSLMHDLRPKVLAIKTYEEAGVMVVQGKASTIINEDVLNYFINGYFSQTKTCPLYVASERLFEGSAVCFAFPKGSPLKAKMDPIILNLKESGIMNHLKVKNAEGCLTKGASSDNSLRPLALGDFHGVLSLYAGGVILATLIFGAEIIAAKKKIQH